MIFFHKFYISVIIKIWVFKCCFFVETFFLEKTFMLRLDWPSCSLYSSSISLQALVSKVCFWNPEIGIYTDMAVEYWIMFLNGCSQDMAVWKTCQPQVIYYLWKLIRWMLWKRNSISSTKVLLPYIQRSTCPSVRKCSVKKTSQWKLRLLTSQLPLEWSFHPVYADSVGTVLEEKWYFGESS